MGAGDRDRGPRWQQGQDRHPRGLSDGKPFWRSRLSLGVARLLARCRVEASILRLSLVGLALPLRLPHGYDLARGAPTSGVIPPDNPAHQEVYQARVVIDPILKVHVVALFFFRDLEVQFEGMAEVVKDQGFALVHPVTLGYVCDPVPVDLHVFSLLLAPHHRALAPTRTRSARLVARDRLVRGRVVEGIARFGGFTGPARRS